MEVESALPIIFGIPTIPASRTAMNNNENIFETNRI